MERNIILILKIQFWCGWYQSTVNMGATLSFPHTNSHTKSKQTCSLTDDLEIIWLISLHPLWRISLNTVMEEKENASLLLGMWLLLTKRKYNHSNKHTHIHTKSKYLSTDCLFLMHAFKNIDSTANNGNNFSLLYMSYKWIVFCCCCFVLWNLFIYLFIFTAGKTLRNM